MISQPSEAERTALAASLAPARLRPYRSVFGGDTRSAVSLYLFEMELVAATQQVVAAVEVLMRETMHRHLASVYGDFWFFTERSRLDDRTREEVQKATKFLPRRPLAGKVIAEMTFGAWTYLLEPGDSIDRGTPAARFADYEADLWRPALQTAFSANGALSRQKASELARRARWLRNRLSHRESFIFGLPLPGQKIHTPRGTLLVRQEPQHALDDLRELASSLDQTVGSWLARCDAADKMLASPVAQQALSYIKGAHSAHWI